MQHNSDKRNYHLAYCKICHYRDFDLSKGITCVLTKDVADFEDECPSMQLDYEELEDTQIDMNHAIINHVHNNFSVSSLKKGDYLAPTHPITPKYHTKEKTHELKIRVSSHENPWAALSCIISVSCIFGAFNVESNGYKGLLGFFGVILFCVFIVRMVIDYHTPKKIIFTADELGFTFRDKRFFWHDIIDFRIITYRTTGKNAEEYVQAIIGTTTKGIQTIEFYKEEITGEELLEIFRLHQKDYLTRYERNLPDII